MTDKQPAQFDWATELSDAQGHVTLSEQEAKEIGARLRSMGAKLKVYEDLGDAADDVQLLRMGYAAARLEIESLKAQLAAPQGPVNAYGLLANVLEAYEGIPINMRTRGDTGLPFDNKVAAAFKVLQAALAAGQATAAKQPDSENLRKALQFYADSEHFIKSDGDAWDTVSDEPQNYWCDEAGTATVEDGSIARLALSGQPVQFEDDTPQSEQPGAAYAALSEERAAFERWNKDANQGYDLAPCTSGKLQTFESTETEHAWRGFFHGLRASHGQAPAQPQHIEAMERAWLWMENQADGQSKGGHSTFDLMMLREERDALRAAIDVAAPPTAQAGGWVSVEERLPAKNTEVLICFAESTLPSTGQYTGHAADPAGWCYPKESYLWPGESEKLPDGGAPTVTHWMPLPLPPTSAEGVEHG